MSRLLLTAAVLAVLVYVMVLGVRWLSPRIEQDISDRVNTTLAEKGLLWADVTVNGRDVELRGTAPNGEAKSDAVRVVSHVFGVSKVIDNLKVAGAKNTPVSGTSVTETATSSTIDDVAEEAKAAGIYTLEIDKNGGDVVLNGNVPDQDSKDVLMKLAALHYGKDHVKDNLTVVKGAPAGWRAAAGAVLMHIANLENARVMISGTDVMVSGTALDEQFSDQVQNNVKTVLPRSYKAVFAVEVVTPTTAAVEPAEGTSSTDVSGTTCDHMADVSQQKLHFGFDKATLTEAHTKPLKAVAKLVKGCDEGKIVVAGYTDSTGSALYNKWLSQQRAEAGERGLIREGVDKGRMKVIGYGENYPAASNRTRAGRAQNRRVEFSAGDALPHKPVSLSHKRGAHWRAVEHDMDKHADAKPAVKIEQGSVVQEAPAKIKKPWWAKSGNAVEPAAGPSETKALDNDMQNLVAPQPMYPKQPEFGVDQVK